MIHHILTLVVIKTVVHKLVTHVTLQNVVESSQMTVFHNANHIDRLYIMNEVLMIH